MNKRRINSVHKKRTAIVATVLCLVSAVGMAGVYRLEKLRSTEEESLVNWEDIASEKEDSQNQISNLETANSGTDKGENTTQAAVGQEQLSLAGTDDVSAQAEDNAATQDAATAQNSEGQSADAGLTQEDAAQAAVNNAVTLNFTKNDKLLWPVRGNIILDYSMSSSIYFPTLDQYKYNPAIAIQSEVGTEVSAAAAGKVESIEQSDETGLTLTIDMGNNYKAIYGQLEGVNLSTGSYVEKGQIIATVSAPTKYYTVEGCNLYFKVLENGKPVDPLDFLE